VASPVTLDLPDAPADPAVLAADGPAGRATIPYQF
jgi:hypothetical protein